MIDVEVGREVRKGRRYGEGKKRWKERKLNPTPPPPPSRIINISYRSFFSRVICYPDEFLPAQNIFVSPALPSPHPIHLQKS